MKDRLRVEAFFEELRRLGSRRTWLEPRPVYVAAGLVLTAAVLMLVVVSGVRQPAQPVPMSPAARQEAAAPPRAEPARQAAEAPAVKTPPAEVPAAAPAGPQAPRRPVRGEVRLAFGWQIHPLYGDWRYHPGVDIAVPEGSPVRAMWAGKVTDVYEDRLYGLTVAVAGGGYTVLYASLAEARVEKGRTVAAGAVVGTAGAAWSEPFPHLHLTVKDGERYVDPQEILARAE